MAKGPRNSLPASSSPGQVLHSPYAGYVAHTAPATLYLFQPSSLYQSLPTPNTLPAPHPSTPPADVGHGVGQVELGNHA